MPKSVGDMIGYDDTQLPEAGPSLVVVAIGTSTGGDCLSLLLHLEHTIGNIKNNPNSYVSRTFI